MQLLSVLQRNKKERVKGKLLYLAKKKKQKEKKANFCLAFNKFVRQSHELNEHIKFPQTNKQTRGTHTHHSPRCHFRHVSLSPTKSSLYLSHYSCQLITIHHIIHPQIHTYMTCCMYVCVCASSSIIHHHKLAYSLALQAQHQHGFKSSLSTPSSFL